MAGPERRVPAVEEGGAAFGAGPRVGRVTSFDPRRGLGTVTSDAGPEFGFHATAVADGSRHVAVGTRVVFSVAAGRRGRYEARSLVAVPPAPSS